MNPRQLGGIEGGRALWRQTRGWVCEVRIERLSDSLSEDLQAQRNFSRGQSTAELCNAPAIEGYQVLTTERSKLFQSLYLFD
jgi:hypothetical protein